MSDFGYFVLVDHRLIRRAPSLGRREWSRLPLPEPKRVLLIGKRSLSNGSVEFISQDEPLAYRAEERISGYLVVEGMNKAPFLVSAYQPAPQEQKGFF